MQQSTFFQRYQYDPDEDYLGGGGFGKVYLAYDTVLDEPLAVKVAEVRKDMQELSLQNEVALATGLPDHANIAKYKQCYRFKTPQGTFDYGLLKYYKDGNLSQLIRNATLTLAQKEAIANGILSGLEHLHQHNIVHRDLKSSNILIARRSGGAYIPKIADFGLSKQFSDSGRSYFSNSFAGGSILYVAPEQLAGKELRRNVDLWSLGVVLFELFTGQLPFFPHEAPLNSETGRQEIIKQVQAGTIPAKIDRIAEPWQSLIRQCLKPDPKQRLASVDAAWSILGPSPKQPEQFIIEDYTDVDTPKLKVQNPQAEKSVNSKTPKPKPSFRWQPFAMGLAAILLLALGWRWSQLQLGEVSDNNLTSGDTTEIVVPAEEASNPNLPVPIQELERNMVRVQGGTFTMGCTAEQGDDCDGDERPSHEVTLSSYSIGKYEVTQAQWAAVMGNNPSNFDNCVDCPVESVSWEEAQVFLRKLNEMTGKSYRLLTEAEWEYAARGGNQSGGYKYAGGNSISTVAWYDDNSGAKTHEVGRVSPNELGLYDMSGNVWEWCSDWYGDYSGSAQRNPQGPNSGAYRVIRGGSWYSDAWYCRVSIRRFISPDYRFSFLGFRLAAP